MPDPRTLADPRELRLVLGGVLALVAGACAVPPGSKAGDTDSDATDTADTDDSGAVGDSGAVSDSGDSGTVGDSGDSGAVGDSGDSGAIGDSGDSGDSGAGGDSGDSAAACADDLDAFPDSTDTGLLNTVSWGPQDAIAASGCDWPPGNAYVGATCTSGRWDPLAGLTTTVALPNLLLVQGYPWGTTDVVGRSGTPCADATSPTDCEAEATADPSSTVTPYGLPRLVSTSGDVLTVYDTLPELLGLLGTVDTTTEALLVHWFARGSNPSCTPSAFAARPQDRAWQVVGVLDGRDCAPITEFRVRDLVGTDGSVTFEASQLWSTSGACIGRRPPGLRPVAADACTLGEHLARHAELEHASVAAFDQIHAELTALGAPDDLLTEVRRAARDERRHARQVGRLARRYGAEPRPSVVDPTPLRTAEALALDNVTEGCVGETWGALVGLWQAERATDPAVAREMRRIAEDEVRHAALSWRIHGWLLPRLPAEARRRVAEAARRAAEETRGTAEGCELLGLPDASTADRLQASLRDALAA